MASSHEKALGKVKVELGSKAKKNMAHVVESIGHGGKVTSVKKHGSAEGLKKLGY